MEESAMGLPEKTTNKVALILDTFIPYKNQTFFLHKKKVYSKQKGQPTG